MKIEKADERFSSSLEDDNSKELNSSDLNVGKVVRINSSMFHWRRCSLWLLLHDVIWNWISIQLWNHFSETTRNISTGSIGSNKLNDVNCSKFVSLDAVSICFLLDVIKSFFRNIFAFANPFQTFSCFPLALILKLMLLTFNIRILLQRITCNLSWRFLQIWKRIVKS